MITQYGYELDQATKTLDLGAATLEQLSRAGLDCYCCLAHYPEIPSEIKLAFDIQHKIERERLVRRSFFGDHQ